MNCKHVNENNITLLVVASVTVGESTKLGFGTIIQIISICKTKNKDCDKVCLNLTHMIQQHV